MSKLTFFWSPSPSSRILITASLHLLIDSNQARAVALALLYALEAVAARTWFRRASGWWLSGTNSLGTAASKASLTSSSKPYCLRFSSNSHSARPVMGHRRYCFQSVPQSRSCRGAGWRQVLTSSAAESVELLALTSSSKTASSVDFPVLVLTSSCTELLSSQPDRN